MKKIKFLILFIVLTSCNQYLGTVDPDYTPSNEVTQIFSNAQKDTYNSKVDFGNIIYPREINPTLSINNLELDKIMNTDRNSVLNFLYDKIILSKDKKIYVIENNNFEYELNLSKDEEIIHFFGYRDEIYILTNRSKISVIDDQNIIDIGNYEVFTNTTPIVLNETLIIFSVFGDIYEINLDDKSISKKDYFNSKPGISIKSNIFEDQSKLYYLFNSGTLLSFDKNNYDYLNNYILEDLNILSSIGVFNELLDSSFSYKDYLYLIDRSGKISVFNPVSSDILWELDVNQSILSYLFSNDGYLILMTFDKILIISDQGNIINSYTHNKKSPILIFSIKGNIHLISEEGISKLNIFDKSEESFYKNKFTSNLDIYYQDQNIYLKDDKSLFKLSE
ncbi:hypothetical protein OA954_02655 [Alphaproteobacteria bacterium]|nr:hypothetical protein [Alphaproteobacteria bacterium]